MIDKYQLLLERAGRLYERHEAGRQEPFNVFSVLRSASDEVNLHSRFLHALLDYQKSPEIERRNLMDFLQHVVEKKDFKEDGIKVARERDNIDILIINDARPRQVVVIENKIRAEDQPEQLQRYHKTLKDQGYDDIHLLYLTLYGHDPSEYSVGDLDYKTISYKDDLPPWLERCQKRAYDEPALRESVAQYLRLIQKLTGTDFSGAYMNDLKKLCLQDNNLILVHDLKEAMTEAHISLLQKLWCEIESALKVEIPDLPAEDHKQSDISEKRIRHFVTASRNYRYHGLCYTLSSTALLGVMVENTIYFGVGCNKENDEDEYNALMKACENISGDRKDQWNPWGRYDDSGLNLKHPTRENLEFLLDDKKRQEYATKIARDLKEVWKVLKDAGWPR